MSKIHRKVIKKNIDFNTINYAGFEKLFENRKVLIKLNNEKPIIGIFRDITIDHLVIENAKENRYIPISQINSLSIVNDKKRNEWLIFVCGATGALIGALSHDREQDENKEFIENFNSTNIKFIVNSGIGCIVGSLGAYLLVATLNEEQNIIEFTVKQQSGYSSLSEKKFDTMKLIKYLDDKTVKIPIRKTKLIKLLSLSKAIIPSRVLGERIDSFENVKYSIFPEIIDFNEAFLFKLKKTSKNKRRYYALIITDNKILKIKILSEMQIKKMQSIV